MPDRIVAATYLCGAAITGGEITVTDIQSEQLNSLFPLFKKMGCQLKEEHDKVWIKGPQRLRSCGTVRTMPYPGFPTDAQAPWMAISCVADGTSVFVENIFESRYKHAGELMRMGANTVSYTHLAAIKVLQAMPCGGRRIAVLGDMLELGSYSKEAHESVGAMAAEYGVDVVLGFGEESRYLCESAKTHGVNMVYYCEKKPEIVQWLKEHTKRGDTVLLKASRGMKFEEIAEAFYGEE